MSIKTPEERLAGGIHRLNRISAPANAAFTIIFCALAFVCVAPLVFVVIISLSADSSIQKIGYAVVPLEWSAYAYEYMWNSSDRIGRAFMVSICVTVFGTVFGLLMNSTMGYVLSRRMFKLRNLYTMVIFIPMVFGGGMVASYMINTQLLGLRNSFFALILPIAVTPFYIIILRTFFQTTVPDEIIESAKIDGASQFLIFFRIVLPISKPALATIGLFLSFNYWNDWFMSMLYIRSDYMHMYSLQYVLINIERNMEFLRQSSDFISATVSVDRLPLESTRMALVVLVVLPIACAYPFFQQYFVSGLTIGAVKG